MATVSTVPATDAIAPRLANAFPRPRAVLFRLLPLLLPLILIVGWEMAVRFGVGMLLPPPTRVLAALWQLSITGELFEHIGASLRRVAFGYTISVGVGVPFGLLMGYLVWANRLLSGLVNGMRPIPASAWIPLSIILMGIGEKPAVFLVFIGTVWVVILNAMHGVQSVPKHLVWAAKTMGAGERQIFLKVIVPASLPAIFNAMRVAVGVAFTNVIVSELIAVRSGLGYLITEARMVMRPEIVIAGMVTIGVVGFLLDVVVRLVMARSLAWQRGLSAAPSP